MKLVFAIVSDEDGADVVSELNKNGYSVTKLCSTGGFLKAGNTTLLVGVDKEKVGQVLQIIKKKSRSRKQVVNTAMPASDLTGVFTSYPMEVMVGGATIFVLDVEHFDKV